MTKTLLYQLSTLSLGLLLLSPKNINASSNLEVASDSNFSSQTLNFNSGQTVYVKVSADNNGDSKHQLNLRDNQYNQISSYSLAASGPNQFSANFAAPQNEGYYSLEAQIESNGSKSTSVKTIKVGSPQNANVKVNIQSRVEGQSVTTSGNNHEEAIETNSPGQASPSSSPETSPEPEVMGNPDFTFDQNNQSEKVSLVVSVRQFLIRIWSTIWPFK